MKILFIATNIPTIKRRSNGVILRIANMLSKNHQVEVVFPKELIPFWLRFKSKFKPLYNLKDYEIANQKITVLRYLRLPFKPLAFFFLKFINISRFVQNQYDIIHAHFLFPDGLIAQQIAHQSKRPYVVSIRYSDISMIESTWKHSPTIHKAVVCLKNASAVHVLNDYTRQWMKDKFQIDCSVIPHGVELVDPGEASKTNKKLRITCVAEFIPLKQIDWVIKAFKSYYGKQDIKLSIVGSGPLEGALKAMKGSDDRIKFKGHVPHDQVMQILNESSIFVMPSTKETFGLVYLEAAMMHNAIIAYHKYSINGIFEPEEEALFCSGYADFKHQLHRLIENPGLVNKLADNALKKVQEMDWGTIITRYEHLYESAI